MYLTRLLMGAKPGDRFKNLNIHTKDFLVLKEDGTLVWGSSGNLYEGLRVNAYDWVKLPRQEKMLVFKGSSGNPLKCTLGYYIRHETYLMRDGTTIKEYCARNSCEHLPHLDFYVDVKEDE